LAECCVFGKQSVDPFHCDRLHFELLLKNGETPKPNIQAPNKFGGAGQGLEFAAWD
jgi:hypothetical protein